MTNLLDYRRAGPTSFLPTKVNAIEISCDGSLIAVADAGKRLMVFGLEDLASGAAALITMDCLAEIHSLAWSGSSSRIFSGLSDGTLAAATITPVSAS
jgi:WD40 repeat protein